MRAIDITNQRFGRLIALERAENVGRRTFWMVKCDCGTIRPMNLDGIKKSASCGCIKAEKTRDRSLKHGHSTKSAQSRTYKSWSHAKGRCFNPNDEKYEHYGERGITMCEEWTQSFEAFLRDMGQCPEGKSLGRKRVEEGYCLDNCQWETPHQQARARTDNVFVMHEGQRIVLKDFAAATGVPYKRLHARVKYHNQSPHDAVLHIRSNSPIG